MRKLIYLAVAATAFGMAACTPTPGYVITGTIEGATDGDTVLLQEVSGRQMVSIDTAIVSNGTFKFKGTQDSAVNRYLVYPKGGLHMDFFLENGKIAIALTRDSDSATGTPNNDAYQEVRSQLNVLNQKATQAYLTSKDTTLSAEVVEAKTAELDQLEAEMDAVIKTGVEKNITNPVGIMLFKQSFSRIAPKESLAFIQKLPAAVQNEEVIIKIKEMLDKKVKTDIGEKFTDFEMLTPDGKPVKLSDYAGKGKVVLVDFWASWCGPCRQEMPNLVDAYKQYKGKNFEIVGVSLDKSAEPWKEALKKMNMTWPQMSDLKFWDCEGVQLYGITGIPHTVIIDGEGTIIARGLHGDALLAKLAEILK